MTESTSEPPKFTASAPKKPKTKYRVVASATEAVRVTVALLVGAFSFSHDGTVATKP